MPLDDELAILVVRPVLPNFYDTSNGTLPLNYAIWKFHSSRSQRVSFRPVVVLHMNSPAPANGTGMSEPDLTSPFKLSKVLTAGANPKDYTSARHANSWIINDHEHRLYLVFNAH
jgi:hypothetical protein